MPIDASIPLQVRNPKIMTPMEGVALKDMLTQSRFNEATLADLPNVQRRAQEAHDVGQRVSLSNLGEAARKRQIENQQAIDERMKDIASQSYRYGLSVPGDDKAKTMAARQKAIELAEKYKRQGVFANYGLSDEQFQQNIQEIAATDWNGFEAVALTTEEARELAEEKRVYPAAGGAPVEQAAPTEGIPLSEIPTTITAPKGRRYASESPGGFSPEEEKSIRGRERERTRLNELRDRLSTDEQMPAGVPLNKLDKAPAEPASQLERDLAEAEKVEGIGRQGAYKRAKDMRTEAYRAEELRLKKLDLEEKIRKRKEDTAKHIDKLSKEEHDLENKMSKDFMKGSGVFVDTRDAYSRIRVSAQDPSAAGDLSMIFNYMKMLDPGSTVREGEFATAQNAAGVPERVRAFYANIMTGERMTPPQRNDFLNRAQKIYDTILANHEKFEKQWTQRAEDAKVDPSDVVIDLRPAELEGESILKVGDIESDGEGNRYKFLGGDPAKEENWQKVK